MIEKNRKNSILIVDDTPENLSILRKLLTDKGYQVRPALNGEIALKAIATQPPDLILLDIMMPDIKGYEVCKRVKSNPETKDTRIIVLSAYLDEEKFKKMKDYGADACYSKPLPLPQLKDEAARLLGLK